MSLEVSIYRERQFLSRNMANEAAVLEVVLHIQTRANKIRAHLQSAFVVSVPRVLYRGGRKNLCK